MGTTFERNLRADETARLPEAKASMADAGHQGRATKFTFFAAFDGTNNHREKLDLSGDKWPTNVAELADQALAMESVSFRSKYYPGAGTGGDQGGVVQAGVQPTPAIDAAAEHAYADFKDAAIQYLKKAPGATPADLGAAVTGFSRGCAAAIRFAQILNDRGLVADDGTVIAEPGSIPVTGMALMDPVATFVKGPMHIPPNVKGQVLAVVAEHETRSDFRPLYFGDDPRVTTVWHPGNHVGVGGGYDAHGTAANVLEGITRYFQNRGIGIADVAPKRRHDPADPHKLYTEAWKADGFGGPLLDLDGRKEGQWWQDDPTLGRVEVRPDTPPAHAAWLATLRFQMGPQLAAAGYSPDECRRIEASCARWAAEQASSGREPERMMLSLDGGRIATIDRAGAMGEWSIPQALAAADTAGRPTGLGNALAVTERVSAPSMAPEHSASGMSR